MLSPWQHHSAPSSSPTATWTARRSSTASKRWPAGTTTSRWTSSASKPTEEYEACLFDGSGDILIEHLEYLYEKAAGGVEVTFFCAPVIETGMELVVRPGTRSIDELRGGRIAVRQPGRPHAATMRLRHMGLLDDVEVVHINDRDIGRWQQWRRVADGDCAAAWISSLYLPAALDAGLEVLPGA